MQTLNLIVSAVLAFTTPAIAQGADECQSDAVCRFLAQNIGLKEPLTLEQLRRFATVQVDTRSAVKNLHVAGQTDTIHNLRFDRLAIRVYAPATGFVLLQQIVVTSARYTLPLKLVFGTSTLEDVQRALGVPKDVKRLPDGGSRWRYENVEGTASVVFEFDAEPSLRIKRVEWQFSVD